METRTVTLTNNQLNVLTELLERTTSKEFTTTLKGSYTKAIEGSSNLVHKLKTTEGNTFEFDAEELSLLHFTLHLPDQPLVASLYPHTLRHLVTRKVLTNKIPFIQKINENEVDKLTPSM